MGVSYGPARVVIGGKPTATTTPTDGQVLTYDSGAGTWGPEAAAGGGSGYVPLRRYGTTPDVWYGPDFGGDTTTGANPNNNQIRAFPMWIGSEVPDTVAVYVNSVGAAGAKARCGIYTCSATEWYPDALVSGSDGGEFDCAVGTGLKTKSITVSGLTANAWYWIASLDNDTTINWRIFSTITSSVFTNVATNSATAGIVATQTYGAMPSTFPAGGSNGIPTLFPIVLLQFAAP